MYLADSDVVNLLKKASPLLDHSNRILGNGSSSNAGGAACAARTAAQGIIERPGTIRHSDYAMTEQISASKILAGKRHQMLILCIYASLRHNLRRLARLNGTSELAADRSDW